jgi:AcrR family transcriptional regulator
MPVVARNHQKQRSNGAVRDKPSRIARCDDMLAAATTIFAHEGYRNTDVQVIADALGVGKGTIYRCFPTKRDLFLAAADRGMRLMNQEIESAIESINDPLEQISTAIRTYLDFFADHPEYAELLIQERAEFPDRSTPTYFVHREANAGRWKRVYRRLITSGRMRDIPIDRIMSVMSGLVYGTMFINFFTGKKKSTAEQARDLLDVVFNGLLTPRERGARSMKGGEQ